MAQERIRARVWLVGIVPVAVGIAVVVFLLTGDRRDTRTRAASPPASADEPALVQVPTTTSTPSTPTPAPRPSIGFPAPSPVAIAPSGSPAPSAQPEAIPELAEFTPPPGSQSWSMAEKKEYARKAFSDLRARERELEKEQATAHAMGDVPMERQKEATIALLRERRTYYERLMASPDALQGRKTGPPPDMSGDVTGDAGP
jgi:hypothetical protein